MDNDKAFEEWWIKIPNETISLKKYWARKSWNAACEIKDKIIEKLISQLSNFRECRNISLEWVEKEVIKDAKKT